jgi:hypothetical protein
MAIRCPYCGDPQRNGDMASRSRSGLRIGGRGRFDSCLAVECERCGRYFEFHDREELVGMFSSKVPVRDPAPKHPDLCGCPWCGSAERNAYAYISTEFYDDEHFVETHGPRCEVCGRTYYRYEWHAVADRVYLDERGRLLE